MAVTEESSQTAGTVAAEPIAEKPGRKIVTSALLLAMAAAALEQTVVSPAMTRIIAQLKGVDIYPWVISAYLLASTISTPIYGKLADFYGRRKILLVGIGVFAIGSLSCGFAISMPMLIACRTLQGFGAGALGPIVLTMISDLFSLKERAKVQGYFSAVWGLSSIIGPASAGFSRTRFLGVGSSWSPCHSVWSRCGSSIATSPNASKKSPEGRSTGRARYSWQGQLRVSSGRCFRDAR